MSDTAYDDTEPLRKGTARALYIATVFMNSCVTSGLLAVAVDGELKTIALGVFSIISLSAAYSMHRDSIHNTLWNRFAAAGYYDSETGEWK